MTGTLPLAFGEDDYLRELQDAGKALWVATLSDGSCVYQDDGRRGEPAWVCLSRYLAESFLRITCFRLKFRSEWLSAVPDDMPGYFFSRGVGATLGGPAQNFYAVGWVGYDLARLHVRKVHVPELAVFHEEERPLPQNDPRLILVTDFRPGGPS